MLKKYLLVIVYLGVSTISDEKIVEYYLQSVLLKYNNAIFSKKYA